MDIAVFILIGAGLLVLLAILMFMFFYSPSAKRKKKPAKNPHTSDNKHDSSEFDKLVEIIKNEKSGAKELDSAVEKILKNYGNIEKKEGLIPHPQFKVYSDLITTICTHPKTNKKIIIKFEKELISLNPEYKHEINDTVVKGLNSRV